MKIYKQPRVPGFRCTDGIGRVYFVPCEKVRADYIAYLIQADNLTRKQAVAMADAEKEFLSTWFYEQFIWSEVRRDGVLIKGPSAKLVKNAIDFYLSECDHAPGHHCEEVGFKVKQGGQQ